MRLPISVGMPVFNGGQWLPLAIESILDQTFKHFELIIADNASLDNTEAVCRQYAKQDSRIRYYRNNYNIGGPANYNLVFRLSKGKYFKWASANDLCSKEFLARCVSVLDADKGVVLSYPMTKLMDDGGSVIEEYTDNLDLRDEDPCVRFKTFLQNVRLNNAMNGLIRASILSKTMLMRPHLGEDLNLMAELALYGKFAEIPQFLFFRRMGELSATAQSKKTLLEHYDPKQEGKLSLQSWYLHLDYFRAVRRAPLVSNQKRGLYQYVAKLMWWDKSTLASELVHWMWAKHRKNQQKLSEDYDGQ